MSEPAKHTPGPWVFEDYSQEEPEFFVIPATYHGTVAKAFNEPDARLIAASPTMLEALRQCQRALAMMIAPDVIKQTTTLHAFTKCTAAELAAREAIALVDEAQSKDRT